MVGGDTSSAAQALGTLVELAIALSMAYRIFYFPVSGFQGSFQNLVPCRVCVVFARGSRLVLLGTKRKEIRRAKLIFRLPAGQAAEKLFQVGMLHFDRQDFKARLHGKVKQRAAHIVAGVEMQFPHLRGQTLPRRQSG